MVRHASWVALVSLVSLGTTAAPAAAKCAMSHLRPEVLSTDEIAPGGGIVVATEQASYDEPDEGDAVQPTWQLEIGGTRSAPKIDTLAPGLAVYRVPASATAATLFDGKTVRGKITIGTTKAAALAAPKVKGIRHDKSMGRRASAYTTVTLDGAPPAGMVALVLTDAKGTPRSFGVVEDGAAELRVYAHSRCGVVPNNTVESKIGDKVKLFWVDRNGRKSPVSKIVTITGTPATEME
ncbi:MAG: hypothetical protein IPQ07_32445 [Myxococcales bacterium]|nr:hypothetical protein [Myxococcales bacterium]